MNFFKRKKNNDIEFIQQLELFMKEIMNNNIFDVESNKMYTGKIILFIFKKLNIVNFDDALIYFSEQCFSQNNDYYCLDVTYSNDGLIESIELHISDVNRLYYILRSFKKEDITRLIREKKLEDILC